MEREKNYELIEDYGSVDENSNSHISVRKIKWFDRDSKLDIRVWKKTADGDEYPSKGFTFLTENGPHRLTEKMVSLGYGDTHVLKKMLETRPEDSSFADAVNMDDDSADFIDDGYAIPDDDMDSDSDDDDDDTEYYDPRELIK